MPLVNWIRIFLDVYFLKFMATNDIRRHLIAAEEELRLAFVESLENKYDENLSMLVECLNSVKDVIACTPVIRSTDNINDYYRKKAEHDFKLGGDLDAMDNVLQFPIGNDLDLTGNIDLSGIDNINIDTSNDTVTFTPEPGVWGSSTPDIITFGDEKKDDKDDPA